jgi:hypothetical protein
MLWWRATVNFDHWNDAAIEADTAEIRGELRDTGIAGAIEAIRLHIAGVGGWRAVYLLAHSRLKTLAGNHATCW